MTREEMIAEINRLKGEIKLLRSTRTRAETFDSDVPNPSEFAAQLTQSYNDNVFGKISKDFSAAMKQMQIDGNSFFLNFEEGGKFQSGLMRAMDVSQKITGNYKVGSEVMKKLSGNMKTFVSLSESGLQSLTKQSIIFQKLGLDASTYGKILDSARLAYGQSEQEAEQLGNSLMALSIKLSIPAQVLATDFNKAQKSMAYDAEKLNNIFHKLQYTSRTTGINFDTLTSKFGDTMDNFKGSADIAGRLNAVLGDSVFNSIELLGMNEAERVGTITDRVRASLQARGKNVNELGKFELKALASSIGLSPEDTRRLLSGESVDVERALESMSGGNLKEPSEAAAKGLKFFENTLRRTRSELENFNIDLNASLFERRRTESVTGTGAMAGSSFFAADYLKTTRGLTDAMAKRIDAALKPFSMDEFQKRQVSDIAIRDFRIIKRLEAITVQGRQGEKGLLRRVINEFRTAKPAGPAGDFDDRKRGVRVDQRKTIDAYKDFAALQTILTPNLVSAAARVQKKHIEALGAHSAALTAWADASGAAVVNLNVTTTGGRPQPVPLTTAQKAAIVDDVLEILRRR